MDKSWKFIFLLTFILISLPDQCFSRVIHRDIDNAGFVDPDEMLEDRHDLRSKNIGEYSKKRWKEREDDGYELGSKNLQERNPIEIPVPLPFSKPTPSPKGLLGPYANLPGNVRALKGLTGKLLKLNSAALKDIFGSHLELSGIGSSTDITIQTVSFSAACLQVGRLTAGSVRYYTTDASGKVTGQVSQQLSVQLLASRLFAALEVKLSLKVKKIHFKGCKSKCTGEELLAEVWEALRKELEDKLPPWNKDAKAIDKLQNIADLLTSTSNSVINLFIQSMNQGNKFGKSFKHLLRDIYRLVADQIEIDPPANNPEIDYTEVIKDFSEIVRNPGPQVIPQILQLLARINSGQGDEVAGVLKPLLTGAKLKGLLSLTSGGKTVAQWLGLSKADVSLPEVLSKLSGADGIFGPGFKLDSSTLRNHDLPKLIQHIVDIFRGGVDVRLSDIWKAIGYKDLSSSAKVPDFNFKGLDVAKFLQALYDSLNLPKTSKALFGVVLPTPGALLDALKALQSLGTGNYNWLSNGSRYEDIAKIVNGLQGIFNLTILGKFINSFGGDLEHMFEGINSGLKDADRALATSFGVLTGKVSIPALLQSLGVNVSKILSLPKGSTPQSFTLDHFVQLWSNGDFSVLELLNEMTSPSKGLQELLNSLKDLWTTGNSTVWDIATELGVDASKSLRLPGSPELEPSWRKFLQLLLGGSNFTAILEDLQDIIKGDYMKQVFRDWTAVVKGTLKATAFFEKYLGANWRTILNFPPNSNPNDLTFETVLKFALNFNSNALVNRMTSAAHPELKNLVDQLKKLLQGDAPTRSLFIESLNKLFFLGNITGSNIPGLDRTTVAKSFAQAGIDLQAILKTISSTYDDFFKLTKFLERILSDKSNPDTAFAESGVPSLGKLFGSRFDKLDLEALVRFVLSNRSLEEFLARLTSPDSADFQNLLNTLQKLFKGEISLRDALKSVGLPDDLADLRLPGSSQPLSEVFRLVRILLGGQFDLGDLIQNSPSANSPEVRPVLLDIVAFLEGRLKLEAFLSKYGLGDLFKILGVPQDSNVYDIKPKALLDYLSANVLQLPALIAKLPIRNPALQWLVTELAGILAGRITSENAFNGSLTPAVVVDAIKNSAKPQFNVSGVLYDLLGENFVKIVVQLITNVGVGVDELRVLTDVISAFLAEELTAEDLFKKFGIPNVWEVIRLPNGSRSEDFDGDSLIRWLVTNGKYVTTLIRNMRSPNPGLERLRVTLVRFLSGELTVEDLLVYLGIPKDVVDRFGQTNFLTSKAILRIVQVLFGPNTDLIPLLKNYKSINKDLDGLRIRIVALLEGKLSMQDLLKELGIPNALNIPSILKNFLDPKSETERAILDKSTQALPWIKTFLEDLKAVLNGNKDIDSLLRHSIPQFPNLPVNITKFSQAFFGPTIDFGQWIAKLPSPLTVLVRVSKIIEGVFNGEVTWNNLFEGSGIPNPFGLIRLPPWSSPNSLTIESVIRYILDGELKGAILVILSNVDSNNPKSKVLLGNLRDLVNGTITLKVFFANIGSPDSPQFQLPGSNYPNFDWSEFFRVFFQLGINFTELIATSKSNQPELRDLLDNCRQLLEGKITITVFGSKVSNIPNIFDVLHINKNSSLTLQGIFGFVSSTDFSLITNLFAKINSLSPGVKNIVQIIIDILENKITIIEGFNRSGLVIYTPTPHETVSTTTEGSGTNGTTSINDGSYTTTSTYDGSDTTTSIDDGSDTTTSTYDGSDTTTSTYDGSDATTSTYDGSYATTSIDDGSYTTTSIDDGSDTTTSTYDGSNATTSTYDGSYATTSIDDGSYTTTSTYDGSDTTTSTDDGSYTTTSTYDGSDTTTSTDDGSYTTTSTDDGSDTTTSIDDGSDTTTFTDDGSYTTTSTYDGSYTTTSTYDGSDTTTSTYDGSDTTTSTYDGSDTTTSTDDGSDTTTSTYDGSDTTTSTYDGSDTTTSTYDGSYTTTSIDDGSYTTTSIDDGSYTTTSTYDGSDTTTSTDDGSDTTTSTYDGSDTTTSTYDGSDTTTSIDDGSDTTTSTDDGSDTTTSTDDGSDTTTSTYDGSDTTTSIDDGSDTTTSTDDGSDTTTSTYDGSDTTTSTYDGSDTTTSTYDGSDTTTSIDDGSDTTTSTYDGSDTTTSIDDGSDITTSTYDGSDITTSTYDGSDITTSTYDGSDTTTSTSEGSTTNGISGSSTDDCVEVTTPDDEQSGGPGPLPPNVAAILEAFSGSKGLNISLEHLFGKGSGFNIESLLELIKESPEGLPGIIKFLKSVYDIDLKGIIDHNGFNYTALILKSASIGGSICDNIEKWITNDTENFKKFVRGFIVNSQNLNIAKLFSGANGFNLTTFLGPLAVESGAFGPNVRKVLGTSGGALIALVQVLANNSNNANVVQLIGQLLRPLATGSGALVKTLNQILALLVQSGVHLFRILTVYSGGVNITTVIDKLIESPQNLTFYLGILRAQSRVLVEALVNGTIKIGKSFRADSRGILYDVRRTLLEVLRDSSNSTALVSALLKAFGADSLNISNLGESSLKVFLSPTLSANGGVSFLTFFKTLIFNLTGGSNDSYTRSWNISYTIDPGHTPPGGGD